MAECESERTCGKGFSGGERVKYFLYQHSNPIALQKIYKFFDFIERKHILSLYYHVTKTETGNTVVLKDNYLRVTFLI